MTTHGRQYGCVSRVAMGDHIGLDSSLPIGLLRRLLMQGEVDVVPGRASPAGEEGALCGIEPLGNFGRLILNEELSHLGFGPAIQVQISTNLPEPFPAPRGTARYTAKYTCSTCALRASWHNGCLPSQPPCARRVPEHIGREVDMLALGKRRVGLRGDLLQSVVHVLRRQPAAGSGLKERPGRAQRGTSPCHSLQFAGVLSSTELPVEE